MIDFVSVVDGNIELWSGDEFFGAWCSPGMIAEVINENGGLAPTVFRSSDWYEAEALGFDSQEQLETLWTKVMEAL
jgi:hypothetical protein